MLQNPFIIVYIALGVLTCLVVFLIWQILKLKKRLDMFVGKETKGLEETLTRLVEKSEKNERTIQEILKRVSELEKIARVSLQKVGVVRYNPFKEVGGNQSFSISLLDSENSGFVITSLYMRNETKIFAKPVIKGESEYPLSEEERKAMAQAKACNF